MRDCVYCCVECDRDGFPAWIFGSFAGTIKCWRCKGEEKVGIYLCDCVWSDMARRTNV